MSKNIILYGEIKIYIDAENITLLKNSPIYQLIPTETIVDISFEENDEPGLRNYSLTMIMSNLLLQNSPGINSTQKGFAEEFISNEVFTQKNFISLLIQSINLYHIDVYDLVFFDAWLEDTLIVNDKTSKIKFIRKSPEQYSLLYLTEVPYESNKSSSKDLSNIYFSYNLEERYKPDNNKFSIINDVVYLQQDIKLLDNIDFSICDVNRVEVRYTRSKKNIKILGYNNCVLTDIFLVDIKPTVNKMNKKIYHKLKILKTPAVYTS